jgi:hypothetical protein
MGVGRRSIGRRLQFLLAATVKVVEWLVEKCAEYGRPAAAAGVCVIPGRKRSLQSADRRIGKRGDIPNIGQHSLLQYRGLVSGLTGAVIYALKMNVPISFWPFIPQSSPVSQSRLSADAHCSQFELVS